jgi:hypothetical protein
MTSIDIDAAIRSHNYWRRQFLNAFAGGGYADMPLSEHRGCTLGKALLDVGADHGGTPAWRDLLRAHDRFHQIAGEIIELAGNGLADEADLLLPELSEASHQLAAALDGLR